MSKPQVRSLCQSIHRDAATPLRLLTRCSSARPFTPALRAVPLCAYLPPIFSLSAPRMLRLLFLTSVLAAPAVLAQQAAPWQQTVAYDMDVRLDTDRHHLAGRQRLVYTNNSPDTLRQVFYHLYFNAFQPTSMMAERNRHLPDPDRRIVPRIFELGPDEIGYQRIASLTQDGVPVPFRVDDTVMQVDLARPIPPGTSSTFEIVFEAQVPLQTRRSGRDNREGIDYSMTQWYPKMAAYDALGWHADPYVGREFYAPFGTFDVRITLPSAYDARRDGRAAERERRRPRLRRAVAVAHDRSFRCRRLAHVALPRRARPRLRVGRRPRLPPHPAPRGRRARPRRARRTPPPLSTRRGGSLGRARRADGGADPLPQRAVRDLSVPAVHRRAGRGRRDGVPDDDARHRRPLAGLRSSARRRTSSPTCGSTPSSPPTRPTSRGWTRGSRASSRAKPAPTCDAAMVQSPRRPPTTHTPARPSSASSFSTSTNARTSPPTGSRRTGPTARPRTPPAKPSPTSSAT